MVHRSRALTGVAVAATPLGVCIVGNDAAGADFLDARTLATLLKIVDVAGQMQTTSAKKGYSVKEWCAAYGTFRVLWVRLDANRDCRLFVQFAPVLHDFF